MISLTNRQPSNFNSLLYFLHIQQGFDNFYSEPNWLTVTCSLCHTRQWLANILIIRLNCVAPKWSNSYSRVHHLLGQIVTWKGIHHITSKCDSCHSKIKLRLIFGKLNEFLVAFKIKCFKCIRLSILLHLL